MPQKMAKAIGENIFMMIGGADGAVKEATLSVKICFRSNDCAF